jgi:hypothetical protein
MLLLGTSLGAKLDLSLPPFHAQLEVNCIFSQPKLSPSRQSKHQNSANWGVSLTAKNEHQILKTDEFHCLR